MIIPFDDEFARASRPRSSSTRCWSRSSAPRTSRSGRTSASATRRRATPDAARRERVRDARGAAGGGRRRAVSSSHIRGLVARRREEAAGCLGAPFMLEGEVVDGDERGRDARVPDGEPRARRRDSSPRATASTPRWAHGHAAAVNVGVRPQFVTGRGLLIEAYLLDFDGDLYGETLRSRSSSASAASGASTRVEALVEQMERDVEDARDRVLARLLPFPRHDADRREASARSSPSCGKRPRGHGFHRGPGRAAHRAHQRAHRAPAHAPQGPPLAPRPADARRQAPPAPELPAAARPRRATASSSRSSASAGGRLSGRTGAGVQASRPGRTAGHAGGPARPATVLVFYPLDFSPVCTDQLHVYEEVLDDFARAGREALRRLVRLA